MKLIVGLGNPGAKYDGTRHNVGFEVVNALATRWQVSMTSQKFHGWFGDGVCGTQRVALLKPTTFMNRSGQAVQAAGRFYKLDFADLLVVTDDLALPLGRIRLRGSGSSGGHNGLQDILDRIGSDAWSRLRFGIDEALGDPSSYVLGRFAPDERAVVARSVSYACDAVECWIEHGVDLAMTRYNGDPPS